MKTLPFLSFLLALATLSHADLVMQLKTEGPDQKGTTTIKVKGTKGRMEVPSPNGQLVALFDSAAKRVILLLPDRKMALTTDLANFRRHSEERIHEVNGPGPYDPKPAASGKKEKIGDWDTEEYVIPLHGAAGGDLHLWMASEFPDAASIRKQMETFNVGGLIDKATVHLPGVIVKSEHPSRGGIVTSILQSVKEEPVADADFAVPPDYQEVAMPAATGDPL